MLPEQEKTKAQLEAELQRAHKIIEQQDEKLCAYAREKVHYQKALDMSSCGYQILDKLDKAEKAIIDLNKSLKNILDSMPAEIYVVDIHSSEILYMNKKMQRSYGRNCVGQTCYQAFYKASAPCEDCNYLKKAGKLDRYSEILTWENYNHLLNRWHLNYDCPVPWADGRNVRIRIALDISQRKEAEKDLLMAKQELESYTRKLEEKNIALNVLLENREEEKDKLRTTISTNFDKLVLPYFEKFKKTREKEELLTLASILETNIRESLSPLERPVAKAYKQLSPMEIQVADLIRAGKTSKEIASLLEISVRSVFFHRNNIRQKLDIQKTRTNLYTFLTSLD